MERVKTLAWFIQRPFMYGHFVRTVGNKLFPGERENTRAEAKDWCNSVAISSAAAISKLTGLNSFKPLQEVFPEEFKYAHKKYQDCPHTMGGPGDLDLLYHLAAQGERNRVIETGVAYGWSTLALLLAIKSRPKARLISTDMPYIKMNNEEFVGCVVPPALRNQWKLIRRPDRTALPQALKELGGVDLCHYDSDKSYRGRMWAYPILWKNLSADGILISDDISDNTAFRDFAQMINTPPTVIKMAVMISPTEAKPEEDKFIGVLRK